MRVTIRDRIVQLDRVALQDCLRAEGWREGEIKTLNIYIKQGCPRTKTGRTLGRYNGKSVFVFVESDRCLKDLDNTLLHECRHHEQLREEKQVWNARLQKETDPDVRQQIRASWRTQREQERQVEYWNRPHEIDARLFAARLTPQWSFFYWTDPAKAALERPEQPASVLAPVTPLKKMPSTLLLIVFTIWAGLELAQKWGWEGRNHV